MKKLILTIIVLQSFLCFSHPNIFKGWTKNEVANYKKLKELAEYVNGKVKSGINKDTLFKKYIYFDYVLNDTVIARREKRIQTFDTLFYFFRHPIDSLGINNLDAKPLRFYKHDEIYKPFEEQLSKIEPNVLVYYEKNKPSTPKGTLWFDPKTNKLIAWILLKQGGIHYFLSFNLF